MFSKPLAAAILLTLHMIGEPAERPGSPMPRPELLPGQVVEIQLESLQFNDRPSKDAGIAATFRFASPGNRKMTGPLERFTLLVRSPGFLPLIHHRVVGYGPTEVRGDLAARRVTVIAADGQAFEYEFRLSRDPDSNCWFTDGVIPIPADPVIDPAKIARVAHFTSAA